MAHARANPTLSTATGARAGGHLDLSKIVPSNSLVEGRRQKTLFGDTAQVVAHHSIAPVIGGAGCPLYKVPAESPFA